MGIQFWSGAKLAQATGLSQNYLAKRLRDELPFTLNDIDKIAKALKIEPTVLALSTPLAVDMPKRGRRPASSRGEDKDAASYG